MITTRPGISVNLMDETVKAIKEARRVPDKEDEAKYIAECEKPGLVATFDVPVPATKDEQERKTFTAHRFQLKNSSKHSSAKKAIVYITGHSHNTITALPTMKPILAILADIAEKAGEEINYACYVQDFRGNQPNKTDITKGFYHYPVAQHAADQAALIKKLVSDGYRPEDIFVYGHSYGSNVGLWACDLLIKEDEKLYSGIKLFSDRGVGSPIKSEYMKKWFDEKNCIEAEKILRDNGMIAPEPFLKLASRIGYILIQCVDKDLMVDEPSSLAGSVLVLDEQSDESRRLKASFDAKVWTMQAETADDSHFAELKLLALKSAPHLLSLHLFMAFMTGKQIRLDAAKPFVSPVIDTAKSYDLTKDGDKTVVVEDLPKQLLARKITKDDSGYISVGPHDQAFSALSSLISRLHEYCLVQADDARKYGPDYNKARFRSGYTYRQKVKVAVGIMGHLTAENGPDFDELNKLDDKKSAGAHKEGSLSVIFDDVIKFIKAQEKILPEFKKSIGVYEALLKPFNAWIKSAARKSKSSTKLKHTGSGSTLFPPKSNSDGQMIKYDENIPTVGSPK